MSCTRTQYIHLLFGTSCFFIFYFCLPQRNLCVLGYVCISHLLPHIRMEVAINKVQEEDEEEGSEFFDWKIVIRCAFVRIHTHNILFMFPFRILQYTRNIVIGFVTQMSVISRKRTNNTTLYERSSFGFLAERRASERLSFSRRANGVT